MSNNTWSLLLPEGFQIENLKLGNITFASRDKIFLKGRDTSELAVVYSSYLSKRLSRYRGSNNIGALIMEPVNSRLSCMDILTLHMLWVAWLLLNQSNGLKILVPTLMPHLEEDYLRRPPSTLAVSSRYPSLLQASFDATLAATATPSPLVATTTPFSPTATTTPSLSFISFLLLQP
ncbi:hypothetical protein S245_037088, partial [Arachis hypogaea]